MSNSTTEIDRDSFRMHLARFIPSVYKMLPPLEKPTILDIGCGSGVPTIELARLSRGMITAIDIDQHELDKLQEKCFQLNLDDRIRVRNLSMRAMDFNEDSFDIIWAEGSIINVGFANGLREWRPLLKEDGCLVVHDRDDNVKQKRKQISKYGYTLLESLHVAHTVWWKEYYLPLEKYIRENTDALDSKLLDQVSAEIESFRSKPIGSIYFVMQKTE